MDIDITINKLIAEHRVFELPVPADKVEIHRYNI
ncbi:unnamed protein product [Camellia sinensis]